MPAVILMYHDLAESLAAVAPEHRPYVLAPAVFSSQVKAAAKSGLTCVSISDWVSAETKPSRALTITFDDGHVSNYDYALSILLDSGLRATFFITAGLIGKGETMGWQQIRQLHSAGMEVGSHTLTHRPPSTLSDKELRHELLESRRVLEDGLGVAVTSISSPTGFFNERMRDIAEESGYRALCIGRIGFAAEDGDPFSLNRIAIKRSINQRQFAHLLRLDRLTVVSLRSRQWTRDLARTIVGPNGYLRLRKALMRGLPA